MIKLIEMIEALLALGGRVFGMAAKAAALVRRAKAERRDPTPAELDEVRSMDDLAREELRKAVGE